MAQDTSDESMIAGKACGRCGADNAPEHEILDQIAGSLAQPSCG
ncbi:MAG: hypothetical protein WCJ55_20125 [Chloroflexales bacterium]